MAINFPSNPTDGQTYSNPVNGIQYTYSNTSTSWEVTYNNVGFSLSVTTQSFVANGTQNTFSLNTTITDTNNSIVTVNGLVLTPINDYVYSGNTLNLQFTPIVGDEVEVKNLGSNTVSSSTPSISLNKVFFYSTIIGG